MSPKSLVLLSALSLSVDAFAPPSMQLHHHSSQCQTTILPNRKLRASSALGMSDFDFPSAMPEKPVQTPEEKLRDSATSFIADITARLGEGVCPPPELEELKKIRDDEGSTVNDLSLKIYELMIGMMYDVDADTGVLTPTQFDIKNNLDIPEVKAEFKHLYTYGMELIKRGLIDLETAKDCVKTRLIERTGLSPEKFDEWLGF